MPHKILRIWEAITKYGWSVVPLPPHIPSKTLTFHQFDHLKDAIRFTKFENNDEEPAQ
jgi:hypothetical protein